MSAAPRTHATPSAKRAETLLAFDFGTRFTGVAVGDTETGLAHAVETIDTEAADVRFARIGALIDEWRPSRLVVGLPLDMDGTEHELTAKARRFARQLEGRYGLAVTLVDERLTSADAARRLAETGRGGRRAKDLVHPLAAQTILQDYLDEQRRTA